jgi:Spy/CpxP family protein refolding chaperone
LGVKPFIFRIIQREIQLQFQKTNFKMEIMKTKLLMMIVFVGLTTAIYAQPKEQGDFKSPRGPKPEARMERNHDEPQQGLNLTDEQKEAFKQGMIAVQKQMQPLRNQLGEAEAHQRTLMTAEKPDLKDINKNIEKIGEIKVEMAKLQAKYHLEMRAQLNDEQKLKFDMFKHQMRDGKGMKGPKGPKGQKGIDREMRHPLN